MKRIYETAAAKALSAWIVLDHKGKHASTVRAHYGQSRVLVEVCNKDGDIQQGSASGYGYDYDKFTAALSGLTVAGHVMTDHCEARLKPPRGRQTWPRDAKPRKGYAFANFASGSKRNYDGSRAYPWMPEGEEGYSSCYRKEGLKFLEALGFAVLQAV